MYNAPGATMGYILVIEDNQANADITIRILEAAGYTVKHVLRGLEGAKLARTDRPDLILMDFDLPDVNGRTLTLVIKRQLGDVKAPPIVAVTGNTSEREIRLAQAFGCSAFVSKPFLPDDLLMVVHHLLNGE